MIICMPSFTSFAQNLIPNSSFEELDTCDESISFGSTISNSLNWFNVVGSVDWFDACSCNMHSTYCIPNTLGGYSYAEDGDNMIGILPFFYIGNNVREAAGVKINSLLQKDSAYCLSFHIKNSHHNNFNYSIDRFDLLFYDDTTNFGAMSSHSPSISFDISQVIDTSWVELSGYYIADGTEQYMALGIFGAIPNWHHENPSNPSDAVFNHLYYFIDNISVTPCSKDSLLEVKIELPNVLTSNNDSKNELYVIKHNNIKTMNVEIRNRWGNVVRKYDGLAEVWDGNDNNGNPLTEGVYFVHVLAESKFGDFLEKRQFVHLIH